MFAAEYTELSQGSRYITNEDLSVEQVKKKWWRFIKNKTFPLEFDGDTEDIVSYLRSGSINSSYIKQSALDKLKTDKRLKFIQDQTRYALLYHNDSPKPDHSLTPTTILEHIPHLKEVYRRLKSHYYYRFYLNVQYVGKLSRVKDEPPYMFALKNPDDKLTIYYHDQDHIYIYYNENSPEELHSYFRDYKYILYGVHNRFLEPVPEMQTITAPDNCEEVALTYLRLKNNNILTQVRAVSLPPKEMLRLTLSRKYKLGIDLQHTAENFILRFVLSPEFILLTYNDNDTTIIIDDYLKVSNMIYSDNNTPESYEKARTILNALGSEPHKYQIITAEQAIDPNQKCNCIFECDKSVLDLQGKEKREIRRIFNKIEREPKFQVKLYTNENYPELENFILNEVIPMRSAWAKRKSEKYVFYEIFVTYYYLQLRPEVREHIPLLIVALFDEDKAQALVVSEQTCKCNIYNTEAVSVERPTLAQSRHILAYHEFKFWYDRTDTPDELVIDIGRTNEQGLKEMKCNMHPSKIYKV